MLKKKTIITLIILASAFIAILFINNNFRIKNFSEKPETNAVSSGIENIKDEKETEPIGEKTIEKKNSERVESKKISNQVPFIVQAPTGNWSDPIFQDGCEEASIIMAMGWVNGIENISTNEALGKIKDIVQFEDKTFGYNADTDLKDVEKIFKQYFKYENVFIREGIVAEDIVVEIEKGNIVLVPAFGRALKNPNFTQPGPIAHMLIVTGYDKEKDEFITNDPGTKRGQNFRYKKSVLIDAIWQYSSGKGPLEIPEKEKMKKGMVVVMIKEG